MTVSWKWNLVLGLALVCVGCSAPDDPDKLHVISAKGTLIIPEMDTADLSLSFVPQDAQNTNSWSRVGKDGAFVISTYEEGDGAAVGTFKVFVSGGAGSMPGEDDRLEKIPAKYRNADTTPWVIDITPLPEENEFTLKVE